MGGCYSMTIIDVKTKIIPENNRIWAIHAGHHRNFFDYFLKDQVVFLELPGFAAAQHTFDSLEAIRQHYRMSEKIAESVRRAAASNPPPTPSRNPGVYETAAGKRGFNSRVGNILSLYKEAKVGDLVLVPAAGNAYGLVLFGEIQTPFSPKDTIEVHRYPGEQIPFRRVRWLPVRIQKRDLPEDIARRLENPHAVSEFNHFTFSTRIYNYAYQTYTAEGQSKTDLPGAQYSGRDPTEPYEAAILVKFFVAAYAAAIDGRESELSGKSVQEIIQEFYNGDLVENFTIEFSSPGKFSLLGKAAALALVVSAGVAFSTNPNAPADAEVKIENSAAPVADATTQKSDDILRGVMNSLDHDTLVQLKNLGQTANEKIGFTSEATVRDIPIPGAKPKPKSK